MAETLTVRSDAPEPVEPPPTAAKRVHPALRSRTLALLGLMGVGKTTIGRALAAALDLPFRDADHEIELAAQRTVAEIFAELGEPAFRDGERRLIARLATQEAPHVLSLGGGAFMNPDTRALLREHAVCIWLKTDLDVLARRVARKATRPLLAGRDPLEVLTAQAAERYPAYGAAAVTVQMGDGSIASSVEAVLAALHAHLGLARPGPPREMP